MLHQRATAVIWDTHSILIRKTLSLAFFSFLGITLPVASLNPPLQHKDNNCNDKNRSNNNSNRTNLPKVKSLQYEPIIFQQRSLLPMSEIIERFWQIPLLGTSPSNLLSAKFSYNRLGKLHIFSGICPSSMFLDKSRYSSCTRLPRLGEISPPNLFRWKSILVITQRPWQTPIKEIITQVHYCNLPGHWI